MAGTTATAALSLVPSPEEALLREAVAGICRGIGRGKTKIAFAITEADAGSNSHKLATSLRRDDGHFVLNGQKTFISGVEDADAVLVVARTRLADGALGLPSLAIVDVDAPGC